MASTTLIAPPRRLAPSSKLDPRTSVCPQCAHVLRVCGLGRRRVYFELDDERLHDPVMNRVCPVCGHGLPGKNRP
jgi:hypothetical protein